MKTPSISHDLVCWGSCESGQDGHGIPNVAVIPFQDGLLRQGFFQGRVKLAACGSSHSVVVTDTDEIYAWGNGRSGQIASLDMFSHRTPINVTLEPPIPNDVTISQVTCGLRHTMVLLSNGQVYAFGNNSYGQLGYDFHTTENCTENQVKPLLLDCIQHKLVKQVACGDRHSVFLFVDGSLAAVGNNSHGQLGDGSRQDSSVPTSVDLDCTVKQIACGRKHNLAISGAGDVYVWGYGKGCGHRKHDVLRPELKLLGHDILQVSGGGTHSMALTNSADIYVWGVGTDGQLGLGERVVTSAFPKRLRHKALRGCVSYVACGEAYSSAVTDGNLYVWGRNSHCIDSDESSKKSFFQPACINTIGEDKRHDSIRSPSGEHYSVHSINCGAWHAIAILGIPDWVPERDEEANGSESEGDESIHDDVMTSEGSQSSRSSINEKNPMTQEYMGHCDGFRLDTSKEPAYEPIEHAGIDKATSPLKRQINQSPLRFPSRAQTKLTLGEFYAMSDSPSGSKSTTPKSSTRPSPDKYPTHWSPEKEKETNEVRQNLVLSGSQQVTDKENVQQTNSMHNNLTLCPDVHVSSASTSPDFSVISESSLKKRIAENIENNKGINFRTRDWSGHRRAHRMSPMKPMDMTPSPEHDSPLGRLTPRASCRSKAASLTERANTMFISKSTANHFNLPREQTSISKQSMSLMDLGNLRSGSVFENQDNVESASRGTSAGQFHSNASSRLSMVSPYTENDLREILTQKSPDKRKVDVFQTIISTSDTPSNMMRYNRMKDMSGFDQNLDNPFKNNHVLFATPSPNFGANQNHTANGELKPIVDMHRSRTQYGLPTSKHYRKPNLPGVDIKTKMARPGHLHGPSLRGVDDPLQSGKRDKSFGDMTMPRTLSTLEIAAPSIKYVVGNTTNNTTNNNSQGTLVDNSHSSDPTSGNYAQSQNFNLTPRRALNPAGSLWRTRTMAGNSIHKPADLVSDIGALTSEGAMHKDFYSNRPFNNKGGSSSNTSANNVIMMKKNMFFEKAQTSLAISGAGTSGPKGQYLRQINTSASSRNIRKK